MEHFFFENKTLPNDFSAKLLMDLVNKKTLLLIFTDENGKVSNSCANTNELTGLNADELTDKHISELFHPASKTRLMMNLRAALLEEQLPNQNKLSLLIKNNQSLWCQLLSTLVTKNTDDTVLVTHVIQNIDDQKQLKDDLTDTETLQKLVLENIPDPIFVKDAEFKIVLANEAFLNFYPTDKRSKILGTTTLEDYDPDEMNAFLEQDKISFRDGLSEVIEEITVPNGERRVLETKKIRFENSQAKNFILGVSKDITENHQLIQNLKKTNSDLNQFSYIAAHDLKSPMNAIRKIAGWLYEDCINQVDDSSLKHLELLMSRSERMLKLLDDLLDYSTIESKDYPFNEIDLKQAIEQLIDNHDSELRHSFSSDFQKASAPNIPFKTILNNLISNAIKHHPDQSPQINISVNRGLKSDVLTFEDDGEGIPEGFRNVATQAFKTLKPRDQVEGSGVGLSLIKKMVEHYSGKLVLSDSELGGLKITIDWPINKFFIVGGN